MVTAVKICGLTEEKEAQMLIENNVDFGGIVLFYEKSKRACPLEKARKIKGILSENGIKTVAVTVSPTLAQLKAIEDIGFDYLQVHGELLDDVLAQSRLPIIRALHAGEFGERESRKEQGKIAGWLYDGVRAGAGETFDWKLLSKTERDGRLLFLAGGLKPSNVNAAIQEVNPDVIDISSGAEYDSEEEMRCRGTRKSPEKIAELMQNIRK